VRYVNWKNRETNKLSTPPTSPSLPPSSLTNRRPPHLQSHQWRGRRRPSPSLP
jgi:hypothetical protein